MQNLTKAQKKFLYHFFRSRNVEEASAACGFSHDSAYEEGMKILSHPQAFGFLASMAVTMKKASCSTVEDALERLINGRINDAVILAETSQEELTEADIRKLDLYNVSEFKIGKGICEIKFADRLKAIEKLNEIRTGKAVDDLAQSFFDAIGKAADSTVAENTAAKNEN